MALAEERQWQAWEAMAEAFEAMAEAWHRCMRIAGQTPGKMALKKGFKQKGFHKKASSRRASTKSPQQKGVLEG